MNGLTMGRSPRWLEGWPSQVALALLFALAILVPMALGYCGCTMFSLAAGTTVLACTLLVGNRAFGALTSEREKRTLDALRVTQLTAGQVLLAKLSPDFRLLRRLLLALAPTVLLSAVLSGAGPGIGLTVVGLAAVGGLFAGVGGIFISSLFDTTSRAVVGGWIVKGVWLMVTPLMDALVGAVLVSDKAPPVFSSFNPLAALGVLLVPEGAVGARELLPLLFFPATLAACGLMFWTAARRFDSGLTSGGGLEDRTVHHAYKGCGPRWLQALFPSLAKNPSFMREMALQLRSGAGRWPGYAVFLVLFLAPFVYAHSWGVQNQVRHVQDRSPVVVKQDSAAAGIQQSAGPVASHNEVRLQAPGLGDMELVLKGHTGHACFRLYLNRMLGTPLPEHDLVMVATRQPSGSIYDGVLRSPGQVEVPLDREARVELGIERVDSTRGMSANQREKTQQAAFSLGIAGAVALLLLYLALRCSGFLATAVTGEKDRRSWEDLALSGITPATALSGKLAGALGLTLLQMTVTFPVMFFFVWNGSLGWFEALGIYLFAALTAITAGFLGLWTSATSNTSHEAQGRAALGVILAFVVAPMAASYLGIYLALAALGLGILALATGRSRVGRALAGMAAALFVCPAVASPLTAVMAFSSTLGTSDVSFLQALDVTTTFGPGFNLLAGLLFMGSLGCLLWTLTIDSLRDPNQEDALRASLA